MAVGMTDVDTIFDFTSQLAGSFSSFLARSMGIIESGRDNGMLKLFVVVNFKRQDPQHHFQNSMHVVEKILSIIFPILFSHPYPKPRPKI